MHLLLFAPLGAQGHNLLLCTEANVLAVSSVYSRPISTRKNVMLGFSMIIPNYEFFLIRHHLQLSTTAIRVVHQVSPATGEKLALGKTRSIVPCYSHSSTILAELCLHCKSWWGHTFKWCGHRQIKENVSINLGGFCLQQ